MRLIGLPQDRNQGSVTYLTGGTTGTPRGIRYSTSKWLRSVNIKRRLLRLHEVGSGSRFCILHPFAPWSIGQVYLEGALSCGADVFPIGINLRTPIVESLIRRVRPTHIAAGCRDLIRLGTELNQRGLDCTKIPVRKLFVAGELLTDEMRGRCEELWKATVVNVYGMSDFDALGMELDGFHGIGLVHDYSYGLRIKNRKRALSVGAIGELAILDPWKKKWFYSADIIKVLSSQHATRNSDLPTWFITVIGRTSLVAKFSDGATIHEAQVLEVLRSCPNLTAIQLIVKRSHLGDAVTVYCVAASHKRERSLKQSILQLLLDKNFELADSFASGGISNLTVKLVPEGYLQKTPRGKTPLIFVEQ